MTSNITFNKTSTINIELPSSAMLTVPMGNYVYAKGPTGTDNDLRFLHVDLQSIAVAMVGHGKESIYPTVMMAHIDDVAPTCEASKTANIIESQLEYFSRKKLTTDLSAHIISHPGHRVLAKALTDKLQDSGFKIDSNVCNMLGTLTVDLTSGKPVILNQNIELAQYIDPDTQSYWYKPNTRKNSGHNFLTKKGPRIDYMGDISNTFSQQQWVRVEPIQPARKNTDSIKRVSFITNNL